jgi:DNA-directed RNA polymerase specialized sigma24 family protein
MKPKIKKKKKNKKTYYVNPKEFLSQLTEFYESDDLKDELATSVYKIAVGLSYSPNFINYSYKDDMIGDAVVKMVAAVNNKKFNLDSGSNPFSYFTTIAFHAFINRIKKEKKYRDTIKDYQE